MRSLVYASLAATLLTVLSTVGCASGDGKDDDGISGSWDLRAEDTRDLWIWLDSDFPSDDEYFTVTASPTAVPIGAFDGGVQVDLSFATESERDTGDTEPQVLDVTVELLLNGEVVASATASSDESASVVDAEGPLSCVVGEACTLSYTLRATTDSAGMIVTADAVLSAWILGSGDPPADAKLSITDF